MPRGRKTTLTIGRTPAERQTLQAWQRSPTLPAGLARRGRILLLVTEGRTISAIAETVGISRRFVYKWVQRFVAQGVEGLAITTGHKMSQNHRFENVPGSVLGVLQTG